MEQIARLKANHFYQYTTIHVSFSKLPGTESHGAFKA